jgi:NodT family efflux transporter outer membrane factor (OMF) lipoprotein
MTEDRWAAMSMATTGLENPIVAEPAVIALAAHEREIGLKLNSIYWRMLVLAMFASLATGCVVGPNFNRPHTPDASTYVAPAAESSEAPSLLYGAKIAADWYTLFRSDALNALVQEALANNPDLEAARHGLVAAQADLRATTGSTLPQVDVSAGASRGRINGSYLYGPADAFSASGNQDSIGPKLTYQLDLFGGERRAIESKTATTSNARHQALDTYITLINQVIVTAFDYASTEARVEVTEEMVDTLRAQLELTRRLEQAGKVTRSDTLVAQTQLENTAATLPGLQRQRLAFANALAQLVGKTPAEFTAPPLALDDFALPESVPVSLPSTLVQQRPDVLAAEDQLHRASAEIGVARAARFPTLSLSAQFLKQGNSLADLASPAANVWSFGLNLAAPIINGGALSARESAARARYDQAAAVYRSTVVGAFVDVADSLQSLEQDSTSHAAYRRAVDSARSSREIVDAQFRAGSVTQLQVLTVQQQYLTAALAEVQSRAERFADVAGLMRALGGGWWNSPQDPAQLSKDQSHE